MKRLLSLVALLLITSVSFADAYFPLETRVANVHPGYCGWATLEMMCRQQGIKAGFGLLEKRRHDKPFRDENGQWVHQGICDRYVIAEKLESLGIKYRMSYGNFHSTREEGRKLIREAMKKGRGAFFAIPGHAMLLTAFEENGKFRYVDPNHAFHKMQDGSLAEFRLPMSWFEEHWTGWTVVLEN